MAMKDLFGYASALSLLLASVAVGCSGEDDDPEQSNLPVFGQGGTGGTAPVAANGGTGGAPPVGAGGTAPVTANGGTGGAPAANGGTGGAPVTANGGTGGAPAANGGTGGVNAGTGGTGTGAGGTASVPPGAGGTGMGGAGMQPPPTGESVSFEDDVWPIFMAQCGGCHTTSGFGGHNVGSPTLATAFADATRLGQTLVDRLDGGGMPPGCSNAGTAPCISVDDLQTVEDWVAGGEAP